jgi:hypothetical protein
MRSRTDVDLGPTLFHFQLGREPVHLLNGKVLVGACEFSLTRARVPTCVRSIWLQQLLCTSQNDLEGPN